MRSLSDFKECTGKKGKSEETSKNLGIKFLLKI